MSTPTEPGGPIHPLKPAAIKPDYEVERADGEAYRIPSGAKWETLKCGQLVVTDESGVVMLFADGAWNTVHRCRSTGR